MNAEIISVGTELLLGQTINTDASFVARALSNVGINLLFSSTVGDNTGRLKAAVEQALERSDLIVTTGGLGPTEDDLTKETICEAAGAKLVLHEESMRRIVEFFKGRVMGETQQKQAMLPQGCTVLENDVGTAPGCAFETANGKIVIMLPGPPSELVPMLENHAVPYLMQRENACIHSVNVHVYGKGEGMVAEMIADVINNENPTVATYAKDGEMFVRVTAKAGSRQQAAELCAPMVKLLADRLGDVVYTTELESLEEVVVDLLKTQGKTIATAESCTGGLLAKRITDVSGASQVFEMGCVTYANRIKHLLLGVPEELLEQYGAVSEQVARAMAEGVRERAGSDLGIGITGVAGPTGGTPEKPVGLVYVALSDGKETLVRAVPRMGRTRSRDYLRWTSSSFALDLARRNLKGLPL